MSSDELRDAIAGALYVRDRFDSSTVVLADAILALPEMQTMLSKDAEIERLRAAGDALARLMPHAHLSVPCRPPQGTPLNEWCSECAALAAWQEARRG